MSVTTDDRHFLQIALTEAGAGFAEGGIPIGACLVADGQVLAAGRNRRVQQGNPILHGEMDALQRAGRRDAAVYRRATMYTTLSPCAMCSGAIVLYGIPRVVIAENRTFRGEEDWLRSRGVEVLCADLPQAVALMERLQRERPALWNEDIGVPS